MYVEEAQSFGNQVAELNHFSIFSRMFRYYYHVPASHWDLVRPTYWHPMASLEQSLMDLEALDQDMMLSSFPLQPHHHLLSVPCTIDDEEFFRDLPVAKDTTATIESVPPSTTPDKRAFSNYSYSSSSVVDDKGRRVRSVRRRFEDASGRLKAVHERTVDGKTLVTTWNKATKDDQGTHETKCLDDTTSPEEFEALWKETPFGKAHQSGEPLPKTTTDKIEDKVTTPEDHAAA
ncbi:unnamed protein product [Aphanomyces euteiches]